MGGKRLGWKYRLGNGRPAPGQSMESDENERELKGDFHR